MAQTRDKFRTIMPTTSLADITPGPPDPLGTKRRNRITRARTSDASQYGLELERVTKKAKLGPGDPSTYPSHKAPPLPPIDRPDPQLLKSEIRLKMERMQFQPLTDDWYWRVLEETYKIEDKHGQWVVDMEKMKLMRIDFRFLLKTLVLPEAPAWSTHSLGHVTPTIVDLYIYLACEYRNRAIARTLRGGDLAGEKPTKQKISCILIDTQRVFWDLSRGWGGPVTYDEEGDVHRAPEQDFALAWKLTKEALDQYDDETFHNLDYVFIPFEFQATHTILMGLAPKQKFALHIDHSGMTRARRDPKYPGHNLPYYNMFCMNILEAVVIEKFGSGSLDTDKLPLFGEWHFRTDNPIRSNRKTDNSPDAPRQTDDYNCSMMTMTSAMNLAFGYDMMCFSNRDHDIDDVPPRTGKRVSVAAELLNGGFNKPFDYPLLKIPTKLQEVILDKSYKQNIRPPPPPPDSESSEDEDESEENSSEETNLGISPQSGARTKVKKGNNGKKDNNGKKVKFSGQPASDPDPLRPESEADDEPVRTLWPAQLDPTRTGKCGFKYPIKKPRFSGLRYKSRTELKRTARANGMIGWHLWEHMPLHMFRAWMENVVAGREDEELTPWVDAIALDAGLEEEPEPGEAGPRIYSY
ncbi:hypothetical protein NHQ30_010097 [Ciborinia camelliae]|nr:hypothetical protein NHQ30_010097 [Ciborinia camelliae]